MPREPKTRVCKFCQRRKPIEHFYIRKDSGRRRLDCKKCRAAAGAAWAKRNPERRKAIALSYAHRNMDKIRAWKKANPIRAKRWDREHPERVRAMKAKWSKNNPGMMLASVRRRQTMKASATPPWSELKAIQAVYIRARKLGKEVDHIVPLRSKIVCGLHVLANLAIVSMKKNRSKGNRHWPDMP